MNGKTLRLLLGVLLFAGASVSLFVPLLLEVTPPAVIYVPIGIGLFAAVYLIGASDPNGFV